MNAEDILVTPFQPAEMSKNLFERAMMGTESTREPFGDRACPGVLGHVVLVGVTGSRYDDGDITVICQPHLAATRAGV
jgi:hypothetical protein